MEKNRLSQQTLQRETSDVLAPQATMKRNGEGLTEHNR